MLLRVRGECQSGKGTYFVDRRKRGGKREGGGGSKQASKQCKQVLLYLVPGKQAIKASNQSQASKQAIKQQRNGRTMGLPRSVRLEVHRVR